MSYPEFRLARLLLSEERIGAPLRRQDQAELGADAQTKAILRARGLEG
jgi:hypothetical protein